MNILAIETSCDDTALAILEVKNKKLKILADFVSSQVKLHAKYGGVYPFLAKREHQRNLPIVLKKTLKEAKLLLKEIDLIAITVGPGLEPCLWTGINFAKELAKKNNLPLMPVNHIEAHMLVNFIDLNSKAEVWQGQTRREMMAKPSANFKIQISKINFPAVCLVVSGGHTQLVLIKGIGKYEIIGETRDDAAGECFDKTARILEIGYPGGPAIAAAAKNKTQKTKNKIELPRPMIYQKNYDFSFSGLKTAVLYDFKNRSKKVRKSKEYIQEMAFKIQQSIIDILIHKTIKAVKDYKVETILLAGGVSANKELRKQFEDKIKKELPKVKYLKPNISLCTDNAIMVAITSYLKKKKHLPGEKNWKKIQADANLRI